MIWNHFWVQKVTFEKMNSKVWILTAKNRKVFFQKFKWTNFDFDFWTFKKLSEHCVNIGFVIFCHCVYLESKALMERPRFSSKAALTFQGIQYDFSRPIMTHSRLFLQRFLAWIIFSQNNLLAKLWDDVLTVNHSHIFKKL